MSDMKDLFKEIAEDFSYNPTRCDEYDSLLCKGEYVFESRYLGSDFSIIATFEDEVSKVDVFFDCRSKMVMQGLTGLIENMIKLLIQDAFIDYKENLED